VLAAAITELSLVEDDGKLLSVDDDDSPDEVFGREELGAAEFVVSDDTAARAEELVEDRVLVEEDAAALQPDIETLKDRKLEFLDRKDQRGLLRESICMADIENERICSRGQ
jgi:hypothetical protein